ncbi:deoxynucleoside triphosphate triphosphohydrolase SAMHD1-like [Poecilia latipinna]|uniref:deoxynucleoside triphosphate triphosphohydrolase SAMHD1-like n=1 Tax=Poecilia latipinna TaxID=48699 RepID=UPI00072EB2A7|nr:PREDICTED: deoxynucleoside triphosphate triphosphohydrolase SAMHD1-like [Poecilia latipinna]
MSLLMFLFLSFCQVFNDPIHGSVELPPLLVKIIDTPQFQRLRNIKQLGGNSYVYPGANHTRFEHSIGVAYLAGELVKALRERQPELKITERDVLCVQIAGLCHDLGHGPFSHLYDGMFIPQMQPDVKQKWKHETASVEMFDHMVKENKLDEEMKKDQEFNKELNSPDISDDMLKEKIKKDLKFIKDLINPEISDEEKKAFTGRGEDKSFLYDIVANKRNGIDVDKWDYFARDCHYLGMKNSFDYRRLILSARVCEWKGRNEICFRDKELFNLYDMFYTRFSLHRRAYQHKTGNIIERMITEAFVKANEYIQIKGSRGQTFNLLTAKDDMEAYTKLTDNVFEQILNDDNQNMREAKEILGKILKRNLYKCLGEFPSKRSEDEIKKIKAQVALPGGTKQDDFVVATSKLDYGKKEKDPIEEVRFYRKSDPNKAITLTREEVSYLLPGNFEERLIRIYCKRTNDQTVENDRQYFKKFKSIHNEFSGPQNEDVAASEESLP